ncbi:ribose-5-phosphate isomerase RpiA [soil metagenome]
MALGLGSGSTAEAFMEALGRLIESGLRVTGVATSHRTEVKAIESGIILTTLMETPSLDLGVDGADEIDPNLDLVKGRGGALLYEKIVAQACQRWVIVAASEKLVDSLGSRIALPVEVIPFGWEQTAASVAAFGLAPRLRTGPYGEPFRTDAGHYILDCESAGIEAPAVLADALKLTTGVVEHGLFIEFADVAMTVDEDGEITTHTRRSYE